MSDIEPILPMQKRGLDYKPERRFLKTLFAFLFVIGAFLVASYMDGRDTPAPATTATSK